MAIDINDIKIGDYLVIKKATPSWVSEDAMKSYAWEFDTPYEVVRVNLRNKAVDLRMNGRLNRSYYHISQLSYPFSYTVDEWNID